MKPKRQQVWDKTNGRCWYCGTGLVVSPEGAAGKAGTIGNWFALDHAVPRSQGGSNDVNNLLPCCWSCNSSKRHKTIEEYRAMLEANARIVNHYNQVCGHDTERFPESVVFFGECFS